MRVLGICSYPVEAACTRYRLTQYVKPLAQRGIELSISPFLTKNDFSSLYQRGNSLQKTSRMLNLASRRFFEFLSRNDFELVLIQREAMLFGPPLTEWLLSTVKKKPLVLDLDDPTYISYVSPTYGRIGSLLKFFGKTNSLIDWSEIVVCGNRYIADYVEKRGRETRVIPTVVDTEVFVPVENKRNKVLTLGWIGTHSTFPFLKKLFPIFEKLAEKYNFVLKVVGAGDATFTDSIKTFEVENLDWSLDRETSDFQTLDIGLYPILPTDIVNQEWLMGKSGFKAIQYLAVGIPFVVTPIGITKEIGIENQTHFTAVTKEDWFNRLSELLESEVLRREMGNKGREFALQHYTVSKQADLLAGVIHQAVEDFKASR